MTAPAPPQRGFDPEAEQEVDFARYVKLLGVRWWLLAAGLVAGKLIGVFGSSVLAIRLGVADLPQDTGWLHMIGISLLCGIGFTMSLFIGLLAFANDLALQSEVKVGILAGSFIAALLGAAVLLMAPAAEVTEEGEG